MIDFPQKLDEKIGPTSPFPFLKKTLRLILGKEKPDWYTRLFCWIGLCVGLYLTFWNALGTLTFFLLDFIEAEKGVYTRNFIADKADVYGFSTENFEQVLFTYHALSGLLWTLMLLSLILVYRQKIAGLWTFVLLAGLLNAFLVFYISWGYYSQELTVTDKIFNLLTLVLGLVLLTIKKKKTNHEEEGEGLAHVDQNLQQ